MDVLKQQIERIQQQLGGLTASQKMLTGALVAIMVMTLLWWGKYAGDSEMASLLGDQQSVAPDDMGRMTNELSNRGVSYKVVGDKIMVPADRKLEILAQLGFAQVLPKDTKTGFDEITKQMSPWDSPQKTEAYFTEAKQRTLSHILQKFPGVEEAQVMIDPTSIRSIARNSVKATATVWLKTHDEGKPSKQLAAAAADLVAGAQSALSRKQIKVIINRVSVPVTDPGEEGSYGGSDDLLEQQNAWEQAFVSKINSQLGFIPGALVAVNVQVNNKTANIQETVVDKKTSIITPSEEMTKEEEQNSASGSSGEPGASPNTGMQTDSASSGGDKTTRTTSSSDIHYMVDPSKKITSTQDRGGDATATGASVLVPRSYFVALYRKNNASANKEPDDKALQPYVSNELTMIRNHVMNCTNLKDDKAVVVDMYADLGTPADVDPLPATAGSGGIAMMLGGHTKEIAVGALAVVSLFMMSMMVKKGAPAPIVAMAAPMIVEPVRLVGGEDLAGEVGSSDAALEGMEMDEDSIRTQQMLGQVQTMVKENPEAAANLVKRWLNRT